MTEFTDDWIRFKWNNFFFDIIGDAINQQRLLILMTVEEYYYVVAAVTKPHISEKQYFIGERKSVYT